MAKHAKFTGHLYQLYASRPLSAGAYVAVNGPHDTYGLVTSVGEKTEQGYLHQIRGCKARTGEKPVCNF